MRLILVVGARPNFIKIAPLVPALEAAGHDVAIAHTGQHYDAVMSDVFFNDLDIPEPRWFLNVGSGTHAVQTGTAMMRLEELLRDERPDALIAVGDVNSTLAAALAAVKIGVPVIHLEAGLRSHDMSMPEEVNRLVTDQLAAMHLAPTQGAVDNLASEGIDPARVFFVGNIMAESLLRNLGRVADPRPRERFGLQAGEYILATIHRPENTDNESNLEQVVAALADAPLPVVMPVHPRTRPLLARAGADSSAANITLTDPVGYLDMLALLRDAAVVVTDSGGVQEESCMLHVPCVTVRRNTEREVTVEAGANRLASADEHEILAGIAAALQGGREWQTPDRWDDRVSERVVDALVQGILPLSGC